MQTIGIDIGGTKIRGVLWSGQRVLRAEEFPTPNNENDFRERIVTLTASLAHQTPLCRIGIGAAGIVEKTTLISSPNIPYIKNFPFKILWPHSMGLRLDNDARCFARAEFLRGAGRGSRSLFALTIGTGVGRAYGKNGKIIRIKKLEYPEPWEREYQFMRNTRDDKELADFLAQKLSPLIRPFNPKVIVIGGGVMEHRSLLQKIRAAFKARGLSARVCPSALGSNTVAIGAALLFD